MKSKIQELVKLLAMSDGIPSVDVYMGGYISNKLIADERVIKILFELKHWSEEVNDETVE